jgi:hypothetical protein
LRDPALAVIELERVAKLGCRTAFVAAMPIKGKSFGRVDFDPVWAAAQDLDVAIGLDFTWYRTATTLAAISITNPNPARCTSP